MLEEGDPSRFEFFDDLICVFGCLFDGVEVLEIVRSVAADAEFDVESTQGIDDFGSVVGCTCPRGMRDKDFQAEIIEQCFEFCWRQAMEPCSRCRLHV